MCLLDALTQQHDAIVEHLALVSAHDPGVRARALDDLADAITDHLAVEQELLYPTVGCCFSPDVMAEVIAEHAEIKRVLADLVWMGVDDARFERKLATLATLFEGHAAWQEQHMFEVVSEEVPHPELVLLETRAAIAPLATAA